MIGREILLALGLSEAFVQLRDPIPEVAFGSDEAPRFFHAGFGQPGVQVAPTPLNQVRELWRDDRVDAPHVGPHGVELPKRSQDILPVIGFVINRMPDDQLAGALAVTVDAPLIESADARRLDAYAQHLQEIYVKAGTLRRKEDEHIIRSPSQLLDAVFAAGSKGIAMQRYKGLGEMNPEQLWETTLDKEVRSLLQVKIRELDEADDLFVKLMGDVVEPRRDFIRENALNVANLDI